MPTSKQTTVLPALPSSLRKASTSAGENTVCTAAPGTACVSCVIAVEPSRRAGMIGRQELFLVYEVAGAVNTGHVSNVPLVVCQSSNDGQAGELSLALTHSLAPDPLPNSFSPTRPPGQRRGTLTALSALAKLTE